MRSGSFKDVTDKLFVDKLYIYVYKWRNYERVSQENYKKPNYIVETSSKG